MRSKLQHAWTLLLVSWLFICTIFPVEAEELAVATWRVEEDWPLNGGGFCALTSGIGSSDSGRVAMMIYMSMEVQGIVLFFDNLPPETSSNVSYWVDDEPRLKTKGRWSDNLIIPFRVHAWVDEWPLFEHMITSGSNFHINYDNDPDSDVTISLVGVEAGYRDWLRCVNRRE